MHYMIQFAINLQVTIDTIKTIQDSTIDIHENQKDTNELVIINEI